MSEKTGRHIHHKMCGHSGERQVMVWYLNAKGERLTQHTMLMAMNQRLEHYTNFTDVNGMDILA